MGDWKAWLRQMLGSTWRRWSPPPVTLRLSPQALGDRPVRSVPIGIAVVAGMSLLVGQSLVLAINRVGRRRGVLTMVTSGAGQVLIAVVEAVMVWAVAIVLLDEPPRVSELLPTVLVSFAPQWLGFLVLLPFTGTGIARLLGLVPGAAGDADSGAGCHGQRRCWWPLPPAGHRGDRRLVNTRRCACASGIPAGQWFGRTPGGT